MRVVADSNVIISALLFDGVPEVVLVSLLGGGDTMVLSPFIIEEVSRILTTKFRVAPADTRLLQQLLGQAELFYFQPYLHVLRDEPDNRVLETAEKGRADYIVTGDKLLLEQAEYRGVKIIRPADFLRL